MGMMSGDGDDSRRPLRRGSCAWTASCAAEPRAEGRFLPGSALFSAGDYPGAVKELAKAVALNPDVPSLQSYYGQALLFTGDADGAVTAFRKNWPPTANDFDANFQLAAIQGAAETPPNRASFWSGPLKSGRDRSRPRPRWPEDSPTSSRLKPGGVAVGSLAPAIGKLDLRRAQRPVVLVFGSYTCPKLRTAAAELKRIASAYHDRIDFRLIYISEAHAQGGAESQWQSTLNLREGIDLPPARNLVEKEAHASLCLRKLSLPFAAVVDGMDAAAEKAYDAWPSRIYLVGPDGACFSKAGWVNWISGRRTWNGPFVRSWQRGDRMGARGRALFLLICLAGPTPGTTARGRGGPAPRHRTAPGRRCGWRHPRIPRVPETVSRQRDGAVEPGCGTGPRGRYDEAIAEYRQALKQQPDNLSVRLNLGLAYYKARNS